MTKHKKTHIKKLESSFPPRFPGRKPLPDGWKNAVKGVHADANKPGLHVMDVEHVPPEVTELHNDPESNQSVMTLYRKKCCIHNCPSCFSEDAVVYSKFRNGKPNKILTLSQTMDVIDEARKIAKNEGNEFKAVKFLGPGELLMNPELFQIIEEYAKRNIFLNIFTKGALLGDDELAVKYQGHAGVSCAKDFVDRLASYENVGLIFSFQSFDPTVQDALVTTKKNDEVRGLENHTERRNRALGHIFSSKFYEQGITQRITLISAPIVPENIDEAFDIYRFSIEHGTPVILTPSMLSGKGRLQIERQMDSIESWFAKLIELYSDIYVYNIIKGIQSLEEIERVGIASYAGMEEPCNQAALGLYLRANGIIQMCPGRFDRETVFGTVKDTPLEELWNNSANKTLGENPQMRINNRCPAKDSICPSQDSQSAFPSDFYEKVMDELKRKLREAGLDC